MKTLVFGMTDNPGGVESVIMNYYRILQTQGVQFDFLCNTHQVAYEDEIISLGGHIYRIPMRSENKVEYESALRAFFDKHGSDYKTIWVNVCSLANIDYLKEAKRVGIPKRIIHSHNSRNMDSLARGMLHLINKRIISKYATDFWACSLEAGKWFYPIKILNQSKFHIIHNAIDTNNFRYNVENRNKIREHEGWVSKFVIGNVGRLHFQKNQTFLLEIFKKVLNEEPSSLLVLVGQGEDKEILERKAESLGIINQVRFLGVKSNIEELLQGFDVFAFPSKFEGLGLALIEAQCSSLPVVASANVIPSEVKITPNFEFVSLDDDVKIWAEHILKFRGVPRDKDDILKVKQAGYDISVESKKLLQLLEGKK